MIDPQHPRGPEKPYPDPEPVVDFLPGHDGHGQHVTGKGVLTVILGVLAAAIVAHACVDTAAQAANVERPIAGAAIG